VKAAPEPYSEPLAFPVEPFSRGDPDLLKPDLKSFFLDLG
jgi:hypothetical protein